MRDIYKRADSVRIWLGPSSGQVDALMDFLEKIGRIMVCNGTPASISSFSLWDVNIFKKPMAETPQISEDYLSWEEVGKTDEALRDLTTREWWSRV